jgi:hypothetical protein
MNVKVCFSGLFIISCCLFALCSCEKKSTSQTHFTKTDSLTGTLLALQDSMLQAWNTMIHDDNRKIKAMHDLLHELMVSNPEKSEELNSYKDRLDHLISLRYDQKSMSDTGIVTEYDFASNSLVTELIALAETQKDFAYNTKLQKLVNNIMEADQRVNNYREEYDFIASQYNRFIEGNRSMLNEISEDSFLEKKPLFQMLAEE